MKKIYLESASLSLKLEDLSDAAATYLVQSPIQGLESASITTNSFPRNGEDGIIISSLFSRERRITLTGRIYNPTSSANLVTLRKALINACEKERDTSGYLKAKWLRFTDMDENEWRITGQVVKLTMPKESPNMAKFLIDFLADNAHIESYATFSQSITPYVGGGYILPVITPKIFTAGSGGSVVINNGAVGDYQAASYPTITFTGPLTNPLLSNDTTGEYFGLTLTMAAGDVITIDTANRTVLQGGVTNRLSLKTAGSTFFQLAPTSNTLRLTTSTTGETGSATVQWRANVTGL